MTDVGIVQTARGAIPRLDLGRTLMHEHVFIVDMDVRHNYPVHLGGRRGPGGERHSKLDELKSLGIDTVVDLTVVGLGRDIPRLVQVAGRTSMQIVVATGLWSLDTLPHYFDSRVLRPELCRHDDRNVRKDITEGIADTGVRAGCSSAPWTRRD